MNNSSEEIFISEPYNHNFRVTSVGTTLPDPNHITNRAIDHKGEIAVEYISSGCGYLEMNEKTYLLKKGDCYIVPQNTNHKYYSDPGNPFSKKWVNVSGEIAFRLVDFYFNGILPIIVPVDVSEDIDQIHSFAKNPSYENAATFSDFSLIPTNKNINLWSNMTLADWKYEYWNKAIKEVNTSHYGGFAFKNNTIAWQNVYTKISGLEPYTEYTISFSVKAHRIHKLEYCSVEQGDELIFAERTVLLTPKNAKNYVSFSVPDTSSTDWTDVSFTFQTKETKGLDHYFNIHYGPSAPTSKECLIIFHKMLCKVAVELYKTFPTTGVLSRIEHIRLYIEEKAKHRLTIDGLSKKFVMSPSQLEKDFKKAFNCSPYRYYMECKMRLAQRQLLIKELSIEQISENLNFSSRFHFEKNFLKIIGETPAAYRKRNLLR